MKKGDSPVSNSTRNGNGPRTPKIDALDRAMTFVQNLQEHDVPREEPQFQDECNNLYQIVDWALTFLDNRRLYHKRMQLKNKITMQLLKQSFNGDLKDIDHQAGAIAEKELFDHVANEPPSTSDVEGGE